MGLAQSTENAGVASSPEELSHVLAERFAVKCFTPLELTHFKDNFYTRAMGHAGVKYWNEKILSDFLGIPDGTESPSGLVTHDCPLDAGPVVFRMVSYLGAFPFQNTMAPSVLTFEAMVKVVVLLTERYGKVLRRGRKDRIRLLFGSLADVGRKDVGQSTESTEVNAEKSEDTSVTTHAPGFAVDEPGNDEDEDDDDDLALAALESLDAIEVFKHDQRVNRAVYEARISVDTFRRLLMLLLVIAPLKPLEPVSKYTTDFSAEHIEAVQKQADSILAAFDPQETGGGISYKSFAKTVSSSLPYLFDPLTPLFEHLLFSKNLDLSQRQVDRTDSSSSDTVEKPPETPPSPLVSVMHPGSFESSILNSSILSHISFFLSPSPSGQNFFRSGTRLHPVFSAGEHGSSLTSFSHHVLTWQSPSLLIIHGAPIGSSDEQEDNLITLGVYLPDPWKVSSSTHSSSKPRDPSSLPCLFQLSPNHMLLQGNSSPSAYKLNTPAAYFSTHSGIAIGCQIPPPARSHHLHPTPHGAGSLLIDTSLDTAELHISPVRTDGVFLSPPGTSERTAAIKTRIDIYHLEVWGLLFPDPGESGSSSPDAVELQRAMWNFEAREAERRRNINLKVGGGESSLESARWLLETAGLIGDGTGRGGGSV